MIVHQSYLSIGNITAIEVLVEGEEGEGCGNGEVRFIICSTGSKSYSIF